MAIPSLSFRIKIALLIALSFIAGFVFIPIVFADELPTPPSDVLQHKIVIQSVAKDGMWIEPLPTVGTKEPIVEPVGSYVGSNDGCPSVIFTSLGRTGCMISFCESGWNPNVTGAQGERGYFQIHPAYHHDSTYDPVGNVAAAVRISGGGASWSAWSVRGVLSSGICPNGVVYPG